ncbi:rod shape-determining protein RodA [Candidatus Roizmanbacteria bacterium CG09_land_8_20_14_0_10_41_9]|uniref:Rod shape-determining protein RodA n=1 Tax=Candidatus Roizmanbacteria bacterium CG09_land_8_20_14_0_10_41_9 TaxID=1974850 RepID=A0A2H0WV84_9BACT|nr:MAG: rod shape-determining protein RodA [Candidatus Roizmanbacteria bacterium CG09_land_8_20_14_0_10_41_9]
MTLEYIIPIIFLCFFSVFNLFGINQRFFVNQISFIVIGFVAYFITRRIGRHFFRMNSFFFYLVFLFALIITFIFGYEVRGSKRWIDLYFFNFQASEFFKIFFILFLSDFLSKSYGHRNTFSRFFVGFVLFLIPTFIIFKQPDLGNAMVLLFIYVLMVYFSSFSKKYIAYFIAAIISFFPIFWLFLKTYQRNRILSFLSPQIDQQGNAYNMIQSIITAGSGKFFGRGLGLGTQSRLFFLPENNTDFAFSSLVEQFGFLGGLLVIVCYILIVFYLVKKAIYFFYQQGDDAKRRFFYVLGFMTYFIFQVFVNIGMNLGMFPVAGIALPIVSYGGSAIATFMIGIALIP